MKKFLDTDHPMFRPLWVRLLVVAVPAFWGLFELATGSPGWGAVFLGLGLYAGWAFRTARHPDDDGGQR